MSYEELKEVPEVNVGNPNSSYERARRRMKDIDNQTIKEANRFSNKIALSAVIISIISLLISIFKK